MEAVVSATHTYLLDVNISAMSDQSFGYFYMAVGECVVERCVIVIARNVD